MNINPVVIELHCDDFLQVTNEHPTCSTLFPFCAPSSVSVLFFFLVCFSLLRFGIVPGRVRTHPEDRQCWFLVYSLFSCSPLLYLFADALVSGSRPKSTFYFVSKQQAFWVRHWALWAQQTLSKLHSSLYYDVICHEVTNVATFLCAAGMFLQQLKKNTWWVGAGTNW